MTDMEANAMIAEVEKLLGVQSRPKPIEPPVYDEAENRKAIKAIAIYFSLLGVASLLAVMMTSRHIDGWDLFISVIAAVVVGVPLLWPLVMFVVAVLVFVGAANMICKLDRVLTKIDRGE